MLDWKSRFKMLFVGGLLFASFSAGWYWGRGKEAATRSQDRNPDRVRVPAVWIGEDGPNFSVRDHVFLRNVFPDDEWIVESDSESVGRRNEPGSYKRWAMLHAKSTGRSLALEGEIGRQLLLVCVDFFPIELAHWIPTRPNPASSLVTPSQMSQGREPEVFDPVPNFLLYLVVEKLTRPDGVYVFPSNKGWPVLSAFAVDFVGNQHEVELVATPENVHDTYVDLFSAVLPDSVSRRELEFVVEDPAANVDFFFRTSRWNWQELADEDALERFKIMCLVEGYHFDQSELE